jgi:squalene cyclase
MTSSLAKDITNTAKWLASLQDHQSGGWGEYKGAHTNDLNTAEAILALLASGEFQAGDAIIQKGAAYLVRSQLDATDALPEDAGAWARRVPGEVGSERYLPDTVRSAFALLALNCAGRPVEDEAIRLGLDWLLRTGNPDGGWGCAAHGDSRLFPSCLALSALS